APLRWSRPKAKPAANPPGANSHAANQPAANQPAANQPAANQPAAPSAGRPTNLRSFVAPVVANERRLSGTDRPIDIRMHPPAPRVTVRGAHCRPYLRSFVAPVVANARRFGLASPDKSDRRSFVADVRCK